MVKTNVAMLNIADVDIDTAINQLLEMNGEIDVRFEDDEVVRMPVRKVIFHMFYWSVVKKWRFQITKRYVVDTQVINSDTLSKIGTLILDDVVGVHPNSFRELNQDIWEVMNRLNNFTIEHCQEYHRSLSALDLAKITKIPAVAEIIADKVVELEGPMSDAQNKLLSNYEKLFEILKTPHPDNNIYPFARLKFINSTQLAHIFYQVGFRTDIGEAVISLPVSSSYFEGLSSLAEYSFEVLSAKKSAFYNKVAIPTSEYFGRRQHLLLSNISTLHKGDCGTKMTNPMMVTDTNKKAMYHKNIMDDSRLITLSAKNIDEYVGRLVHLRSPITCRYSDGVCEVCGGKLISSISPKTHVGIFSGMKLTEVITQTILKAKHFQGTDIIEYKPPAELKEWMLKRKGHIFVKGKFGKKFQSVTLGLAVEDATHLMNLNNVDLSNLNAISESSFGGIKSLLLKRGDVFITDRIDMMFGKQVPMYSKFLVAHIKEHMKDVYIKDGVFHVPMKGFDFKKPLFKLVIVSNSMVKFVADTKKFLETAIAENTSVSVAFNEFCDLIYDQVSPNIVYPEIVIKAIMVTNQFDPRIPIVDDLDNVKFMTNNQLNKMRSLGTSFAYQDLYNTLNDPLTFMVPRTLSPFDTFLNLKKST